jgi:hypothetical protein
MEARPEARYKHFPDHLVKAGAFAILEKEENGDRVHEFHVGVCIDLWQKEPTLVQAEGLGGTELAYRSHSLGRGAGPGKDAAAVVASMANEILDSKEKEGYKIPDNYVRRRFQAKEIRQYLELALMDPAELRTKQAKTARARADLGSELDKLEPLKF